MTSSQNDTQENKISHLDHTQAKSYLKTPLKADSQFLSESMHVCDECQEVFYRRRSITVNGLFDTERTPCSCFKADTSPVVNKFSLKNIEALNNWNMISDAAYSRMTFDNYKSSTTEQAKLLANMKRYAEVFKPGTKGLCLFGYPGRGKTHLALAAAKAIQDRGYTVLAIKTVDLLARLRKSYQSKEDEKEMQILDALRNVDLLILDDLGAEKVTGWVREKLYYTIDYRYNRATTVFTTNLSGEEMAKDMAAIASRVFSTEVNYQVHVTGQDRRVADFSDMGKELTELEVDMRRG